LVLIASRPDRLAAVDPLDGTPRWTAPLPGLLWLLGTDGSAVYAQLETGVTAVRLADGGPAWPGAAAIGPPSGRGVVAAGRVSVPRADSTLAVLDGETGEVVSSVPAPGDEPLGNLLLVGGTVVSHSATRLVAVPSP
jgi:hypothetical protein